MLMSITTPVFCFVEIILESLRPPPPLRSPVPKSGGLASLHLGRRWEEVTKESAGSQRQKEPSRTLKEKYSVLERASY